MFKTKRVVLAIVAILAALAVMVFVWVRSLGHELPALQPSAEADALARAMMEAVGQQAWQDTGAVTWTFRGKNVHLWDRQRGLARVAWTEDGPVLYEAFLDLAGFGGDGDDIGDGLVTRRPKDGAAGELAGDERADRLRQAWRFFVNDSFWLNPVVKLFDDGTRRGLVSPADGDFDDRLRGLLVTYSRGGVTPGDSYLWLVGNDDRPVAWRMWTQILPIQGLETSWQDWQELDTGAYVATRHQTPIGALGLSDVRGARSLAGLLDGTDDPFAELVARSQPAARDETATEEAAIP